MRALTNFCIAAAMLFLAAPAAQASGWRIYRDPQMGFSMSYPDGWRIDTAHLYTALGPGKDIHGVAFTIAPDLAAGTNLSTDSYLAVEMLPGLRKCAATPFLGDAIDAPRIKTAASGIRWSVQDGADAGAGNRYEETVQAAIGTQPCIATRAFVHSTNIGNYDPGTVKEFNRAKLNRIIDKMRASFRISPP